jgi:hypothetical protein
MARGVGKKSDAARPPPQAWLANCLHPGAKVVTAKDVVVAPVIAPNDSAVAKGEKKPRGGGEDAAAGEDEEPRQTRLVMMTTRPKPPRVNLNPRRRTRGRMPTSRTPSGPRLGTNPTRKATSR